MMLGCMRTTLTLDPDVFQAIERLREEDGVSLKAAVNPLPRLGAAEHRRASGPTARIETAPVSLGGCRIGSLDDIGDALAWSEGEAFL